MSAPGRRPWVAVVLSLLCTGLGHLYCGRTARGLVLFLLSLLFAPVAVVVALAPPSNLLFWLLLAVSIAFPLLVVFAVGDSFRIARGLRDGIEIRDGQRPGVYVLFAVVGLLFPAVSAVYLRGHVLEAFRIASSSMEPALHRNDRILVNKLTGRPLRRGDIVVFRHDPEHPRRNYVKRIAGLPGERIELHEGKLLINGKETPYDFGTPRVAPDYPPHEVPPAHYFVLGDNLGHSLDSRELGPIPESDVLGRAVYQIGREHFGKMPKPPYR